MLRKLAGGLVLALGAVGALSAAPEATFGFKGMEFHRLDWDTHGLRLKDVNGDGLTDVVVINNTRARIECLLQRANPAAAPAQETETNEPPNDPRFESRPFLSGKQVFSLAIGDLNGDGRNDMAFYGDPRELVVVYQGADGQWGARRTFAIADGATRPDCLAIGDVNGDGRNDLVLLAVDGTYFIYQDAAGKLEAPVKEAGVPEGALGIAISDFNGDKRADLLYVCGVETAPFCFRFQGPEGRLGPETRCKSPAMRACIPADLDGDGATDVLAIEMPLGRLVAYRVASEAPTGTALDGPIARYALRSSASRRAHAVAFGAFADPKRLDALVSDPDGAQTELFIQDAPGEWRRGGAFPSLQGVTDAATIAGKPDAPAELLVLSPDEPMLGLAKLDERGRLTFPRALPIAGKPTCMAVGDLDGDGKPEVVCGVTQDSERSVRVFARTWDGVFEERARIPITDARADLDGLMIADANGDGRPDILVFSAYQEMRILKALGDWKYTDVSRGPDYGKGLVQGARLKSVSVADVNGDGKPEILVASKNLARALRLDAKDRLEVVEQFNGKTPTSQIVGVAGVDLDGDGTMEVLLVDAANRCISLLKQGKTGAFEIVEDLDIGPVSLERLAVLRLPGEKRPAIVLVGQSDFMVLRPGRPKTVLKEIASYETPVRSGRLDNLAVGNLDKDGHPQVLVTEGSKQAMELLVWTEEGKHLKRVLSWPVFEQKSFRRAGPRGAESNEAEPREFDIADVTNDGKPDIVLLIHDRVLVYVRE